MPLLGAIAGCQWVPLLGVRVPLLGVIGGRHCWAPLLGAIGPLQDAIAGCLCGVPLHC